MKLEATLSGRFDKDIVRNLVLENPSYFDELLTITLNYQSEKAWRAAWIINHVIKKYQKSLNAYTPALISLIPKGDNSLQRELLKMLLKLTLTEDQEGQVFDLAVDIWKDINKQSATRSYAFKHIIKTFKKYPEVQNEILFLTQSHYIECLSPGLKRSVEKMSRVFT